MSFRLLIDTEGAAFDPDGPGIAWELGRILRKLAHRIETEPDESGAVLDSNGNRVGSWELNRDGLDIAEAERRLSLCPDCLQFDYYHDAGCENVDAQDGGGA